MLRGRKQCDPVTGCGKFYDTSFNNCPHCGASEAFSNFIPFNPSDWVYDLETYPNIFTGSFKHAATGNRVFFEYSDRKNELIELINFLYALKNTQCRLIGFNNLGFDYPILHFILECFYMGLSVLDIYNKANEIINTPWEKRFNNIIWDSDIHITQIDLFKIHHFDNKARRTSLKVLEFNMQSESIEDLPFEPGSYLDNTEKYILVNYNDHDVDETEKFYIYSIEMIEFREQLSEKYQKNFLNFSDKKIGSEIFINELEAVTPGICYSYETGSRKTRQTKRDSITLANIIFPYIKFKNPQFEMVREWLASQVITKTKGVFEYIEVKPEMALHMNQELVRVHGLTSDIKGVKLSDCYNDLITHTTEWLQQYKFVSGYKDHSGLNIIVNGFRYDFGTGGIHGSINSTIIYSDDDYVIYDWDVGGFYPSIGNKNKVFPEHLSEQFCIVDEKLAEQRKQYKKGTALNSSIKLARNGAYGDSNNIYSPFYDPQYTMSITINGQLLLCMLAQYLIEIPNLKMIQINTDGLTVRCPKNQVERMKEICKWWENYTCLELESVIYNRMFIRDVNNYIAEDEKGKLKRKGAYGYETPLENLGTLEKPWHKDHSMLIVPKAAEAVLVRGENLETFIKNHNNIFDFMLRAKVGRSNKLLHGDQEIQKISRYYVSKTGQPLKKISPPKEGYIVGQWKRKPGITDEFYKNVIAELNDPAIQHHNDDFDTTGIRWDERINTKNRSKYTQGSTSFNEGYLTSICNNIRDFNRDNLNYDFYIAEAEKLIKPLIGE